MRIAELSTRTDTSVPTIKYYLREGLLFPGRRTSPNQAVYDESHVRRLRLIRALLDVGNLSVAATKSLLEQIDTPGLSAHSAMGKAQYALARDSERDRTHDEAWGRADEEVAALVDRHGWSVKNTNPSQAMLTDIVATLHRLGHEHLIDLLDVYADAAATVAQTEVARVGRTRNVDELAEGVIVATVVGDALFAALRRLAQEDVSRRMFGAEADRTHGESGP
ncbi:MerR family transcriptional regulator [Tsukamurella sp. 8F]|uniref:MerR family transcriptional regulator n=1 Tax=unclassified Tsukamurella TaxID=2633480 RepID=UPI0023B88C81|nr:MULTISPECIES: MerR family transcriptional regulator [unclassified Tsukamurella]MDF0528461.1 MerR family transcriptional regulator [Tsukamurella sp. 8J]MDF0586287.1 MerR family transcriptional regulator [Tsukamurella sp. 8F]